MNKLNKIKEKFLDDLKTETGMTFYEDKNFLFHYYYKHNDINIDELGFKCNLTKGLNYVYGLYHIQNNDDIIIFLFSHIKYNEKEIKRFFYELFLTEKKYIQTKENLENLKLEIVI